MHTKISAAAQYVRMSTDLQKYSIEYQREAIALYAARQGLTIVRSYEDAGRSGVRLNGRSGLQLLIEDVCSGRAEYSTILVYDISRWGRFQDSDESAHYEYLCRKAGVAVEYCAEEFGSGTGLTTAVLKNIKRAMAGEFSRELSVKVFAGQSRAVRDGYHSGSYAGYGLRRILVGEDGVPKAELAFGQRKNMQSERVTLAPGPAHEIKTIHSVYDWFIESQLSLTEIADRLNARNVPGENGNPWTLLTVRTLLTNEKYIGNAIYNRTSQKLGSRQRRNPECEWIRHNGAFEPIVSKERFRQAAIQIAENKRAPSRNELLDTLSAHWCHHGHLTSAMIETSRWSPTPAVFIREFGSIARAFRHIGFNNSENRGRNADLRKQIIGNLTSEITRHGGSVQSMPWAKQLLINGEFTVNVAVGRVKTRPRIWQFGYVSKTKPDILLGARVNEQGTTIADYFILPFMFLPHGAWVTTSQTSGLRLERFQSNTLEPLVALCARTKLEAPQW